MKELGWKPNYVKAEYQRRRVVWRHGNELGRKPNAKYFNNWLYFNKTNQLEQIYLIKKLKKIKKEMALANGPSHEKP